MHEAREALAVYLHTNADSLVYVPNATTGLNIVARSLTFEPGDAVLTTDHEYGALDRTWRLLSRNNGVVLRQRPLSTPMRGTHSMREHLMPVYRHQSIPLLVTTHEDFVERFWSGVTPRTKVIFLSHITSPTALIFRVKEICRCAREAGASASWTARTWSGNCRLNSKTWEPIFMLLIFTSAYLIAKAFGGEATPPSLLSGAEVKKHS